jgi:TolB-like protein
MTQRVSDFLMSWLYNPAPTSTIAAGSTIGAYRILHLLGSGGMGDVYRAHDPRLQRDVALKILPTTDPMHRRRFEREARAVAALNHPNIVTIYSVEEADGVPFLTMELVDGLRLDDLVPASGLPIPELFALAVPMCEAVAAAHQKGIIHRDLKPSNIIVTPDGRVKILDFGLARTIGVDAGDLSAAPTLAATRMGVAVGTVAYMSPEQARGDALDVRTDIFSLGVVLFEMATGRLPFSGVTDAVVFDAILNKAAPSIATGAPDALAELDRVIARALEKKAGDRYAHVADLIADLKAISVASASGATAERLPLEARKPASSIAVLPFTNLSADPEQEYFCEGMAEELIGALAKIRGLAVAARTSSFQLRGLDIAEIGERLNVQAVLEGSVRRMGNRLRISAQLINVADGYHLGADRYDRQADDVFAIQDEIAKAIADSLQVKLASSSSARLVKQATANLEAYNLYLRARYLMNQLTADIGAVYRQAMECFERALALDPSYAGPYAGLSECYNLLGFYTLMPSLAASQAAIEHAERAVALDATLAEGHSALAWAKTVYAIDLGTAERDFLRAIDLAPGYALTYGHYSYLLSVLGRFDEALARINEARQLDPLLLTNRYLLCQVLIGGRQFDRAEREMRDLMELDATLPPTYWYLGFALGGQGKFEEAAGTLDRGLERAGRLPLYVAQAAVMHANAGHRPIADAALAELLGQPHASQYLIALVYAALGDLDPAFRFLQQAIEHHNEVVAIMNVDWRFDPLRGDARFPPLLRALGLGV